MDEKIKARVKNQIFKVDARLGCPSGKDASFSLDFEEREYRQRDLVGLIRDMVPYFALTEDEITSLHKSEWNKVSFTRISDAQPTKKGDYGELLLYIILSIFYKSPKFVTKARLRSSTREQIKGFDCAHFSIDDAGEVKLWLGEAKFHASLSGAISSAFTSITTNFSDATKVKAELKLLGGEIEINKSLSPEHLELLVSYTNGGRSLDKVPIQVPVLVTYDSKCIADSCGTEHADIDSSVFRAKLISELNNNFSLIYSKTWPTKKNITLSFYLVPFKSVSDIKALLDTVETAMKF
jgi:hypothetical protein